MLIRKLFKCESSHIVRNSTSARCSHSIHGHSAVIEVFFRSKDLDNAGMVYDFGLMKNSIKQFIDSMDHCYLLCGLDKSEFKDSFDESEYNLVKRTLNKHGINWRKPVKPEPPVKYKELVAADPKIMKQRNFEAKLKKMLKSEVEADC